MHALALPSSSLELNQRSPKQERKGKEKTRRNKMRGAVLAALAAALGNMLQGWDNATIAGALLYIKKDMPVLQAHPALEGLVVATSLIGATIITTFSGPLSDSVGRRPMLVASSILYTLAGLLMLWSPTVTVLLLARLVDGFAIGLACTLVPVYISETAPPETRGLLNTFPQFTGSTGMFLSYCMVFAMTLAPAPDWRLMLGVLFLPSLLYLLVTLFFLPESPRWLVSKGRMKEAKAVLQMLRGRADVSGELALLVEGLGSGAETAIEEYMVGPPEDEFDPNTMAGKQQQGVKLYGQDCGVSWVAQPVALGSQGSLLGSAISLASSRQGNVLDHLKDPVVALLGSLHGMKPAAADDVNGSMRGGSTLFAGGSMTCAAPVDWDEENAAHDGDDDRDSDDIDAPLLGMRRHSSLADGGGGVETTSTMGIGGGWQLAWKWNEGENTVKRMYLHEEQQSDALADVNDHGQYVHAAALVSQSAMFSTKDMLLAADVQGPAIVHPAEAAAANAGGGGTRWRELLEPGVRHALVCGVTLQILQQFSGISGVLYYTPQILEQAGVGMLLANLGLSAGSTTILISCVTTLLMLPSIGVAMRLMDVSGRRSLLLWTIPVLIVSLGVLVVANLVPMAAAAHAAVSTGSVVVYVCTFVMGFGPIPNILCAEIFPTRVRGLCIAICSLAFWLADIAVAYSLPVMLKSVGLAGVFGFYAVVCCVALVFVALRVPETKGLPLEVIIDFFNVGAKGTLPKLDDDDEY